jgi:hypothetical protein
LVTRRRPSPASFGTPRGASASGACPRNRGEVSGCLARPIPRAAFRVPDLARLEAEPAKAPTFAGAAERWLASRIDVSEGTKFQKRTSVGRAFPLIGDRRVDDLVAQDVADLVVQLHGEEIAIGYLHEVMQAVAMTFDHAGVQPNPARDKRSCGCLATSRRTSTRLAARRS